MENYPICMFMNIVASGLNKLYCAPAAKVPVCSIIWALLLLLVMTRDAGNYPHEYV